jgi:tRNA (guanosine-2'-O-)-methyltransferase
MRSWGNFRNSGMNVIEQRATGKSIDKEIGDGAQKWADINTFDSITTWIH